MPSTNVWSEGKIQQREQALRKRAPVKPETGILSPLSSLGQAGRLQRSRCTRVLRLLCE